MELFLSDTTKINLEKGAEEEAGISICEGGWAFGGKNARFCLELS